MQEAGFETLAEDAEWLKNFEAFVLENLSSDLLNVPDLAKNFVMSESTLLRQLKRLTGQTPGIYIKELRLNHAHRLLESGSINSVSKVAEKVGYSDPRSFSRSFKIKFGKLPSEYLNS